MAAGAVTNQVSGALKGGLEAGAMQEQYKVLAGEVEGAKLFADLKKYVADSVFGPELYENGRTMMAFGIQAKDVMGTMKMLGDVAMGDKEKMDQLTLAFSQTQAAGRLMGQDMIQYVTAGFNPLMVLAEKTGQSYESLKQQMSEGKITADMVRQAFVLATSEGGKYYKMLEKMGKEPKGKIQALFGSIADVKAGFGAQMGPALGKLADVLKPMVDGVPRTLDRIVPIMERGFAQFGALIGPIGELAGAVGSALGPIANMMSSEQMGGVIKSILTLTTKLVEGLTPAIHTLTGVITPLAGAVGKLGDAIGRSHDYWKNIMGGFSSPIGAFVVGKMMGRDWGEMKAAQASIDADKVKKERLATLSSKAKWFDFGLSKTAVAAAASVAAPAGPGQKDPITGGGKKVINIYLNQPMVGQQTFNVGNMQEAVSVGLNEFREMYLRVVRAATEAL